MVCVHCATFPHESAIEYTRLIILGHVIPLVVSTTPNVDGSMPQLSDALPPPAMNAAYVANAAGMAELH